MHKQFLLLLSVLLCAGASAQNAILDSIRNRLQHEKSDTEIVRLHVQLGNRIKSIDTAESWQHQRAIEKIAQQTGNEYFRGQAYFLAATIHLAFVPTQTIEVLSNYEKAINIFGKYPNNRRAGLALGSSYINIGILHFQNNDYETAIYYLLKAEELYQRVDPINPDLSIIYNNLASSYLNLKKFEEGIYYSHKGLELARQKKDKYNLADAYNAYGSNLVMANKGDSSLLYLDSAKVLALELKNVNGQYVADFMKAAYYYNTKQFTKALAQYSAVLEFARSLGATAAMGGDYINMAACEAELKMPQMAAKHLDSSAAIFDYKAYDMNKQMYFENYAEVYRQLGQYEKAFRYKDSVAVIKDSIYKEDNIKQIEFRQARFNYEKKENEVSQLEQEKQLQALALKQKNTLNYFLIALAAILLLVFFLFYRNYQHRQKLQQQRIAELETEKQLTATEAVLKGEEQERTRLSKDLHDGLGGMLSGIKFSLTNMKGTHVMTPDNQQALERSIDMLDNSIREMRRVAHNMMPEALVKFGLDTALKDFCNDINQSGALKIAYQSIGLQDVKVDQLVSITIYRIVQELINNTVKHAAAQNAIVQVSQNNGAISITVEDDGKGFDTSTLQQTKGIGWSNINSRVEFLKGKMDVQSAPGKGTSVHIEM
jgi:signal transduction histidine kinase